MQTSSNSKFCFRIRTRSGAIVDNLLIMGKDEPDAERKLRQVYVGCVILEAKPQVSQPLRSGPMSYEDVVDLISDPGQKEA